MGRNRPGVQDPYAPILAPGSFNHTLCREHVPMEGYEFPVCILRGQDREAVLADARELLDAEQVPGTHGAELSHPTPKRTRHPRSKDTLRRVVP